MNRVCSLLLFAALGVVSLSAYSNDTDKHFDAIFKTLAKRMESIHESNRETEKYNSAIKYLRKISQGLRAKSKNHQRRIEHRRKALRQMGRLPLRLLEHFRKELELLKGYSDDQVRDQAIDLLNILNDPTKTEPPKVRFVDLKIAPNRTSPIKSLQDTTPIEEIETSLLKLQKKRASCQVYQTWNTKLQSYDGFLQAQAKLITDEAQSIIAKAKAKRDEQWKQHEQAQPLPQFKKLDHLRNALYEIKAKQIPEGSTLQSFTRKFTGDLNLGYVIDGRFENPHKIRPSTIFTSLTPKGIDGLGALATPKYQSFFVEDLKKNPAKEFQFTLTEKGRRFFRELNNQHAKYNGTEITKVAVHRLKELDAVSNDYRAQMNQFAKERPELIKALKEYDRIKETMKTTVPNRLRPIQTLQKQVKSALTNVGQCLGTVKHADKASRDISTTHPSLEQVHQAHKLYDRAIQQGTSSRGKIIPLLEQHRPRNE